jgi:leucine dehydrogenase
VHGPAVMEKGILYAPDFLINAGGIINCAWERKGYNRKAALNQTEDIYNTALCASSSAAAEATSPPTWPPTRPPNTA